MQNNEIVKIYETLLSIPGMNEPVKISLKISRKNVLLLTQIIEQGMSKEGKDVAGLLNIADKDAIAAIQQITVDLLERSGLREMKEKLSAFK